MHIPVLKSTIEDLCTALLAGDISAIEALGARSTLASRVEESTLTIGAFGLPQADANGIPERKWVPTLMEFGSLEVGSEGLRRCTLFFLEGAIEGLQTSEARGKGNLITSQVRL